MKNLINMNLFRTKKEYMENGFEVVDKYINKNTYEGNTYKFGITVNDNDYIVKLNENEVSYSYSEFVASNFITNLGIPCHETYLGWYKKQIVVILKDFTQNTAKLRSYKSTEQSSEETDLNDKY